MDPTDTAVTAVRDVGPDAIALDLETPAGFEAQPGQFVKLTAELEGEAESRFYTISSPDVEGTFEVTIGVDPEGTLGPWLAAREPGDTLQITGPFGNDFYEGESRVVVLAGGPGIGPAIGIAERAVADGNEAAVVYRDDAPMHTDRLDALEEAGVPVFVLESDDDLTAPVSSVIENAAREQVFVYGFADFLDVAFDAIDAAGGDSSTAKSENFG